MRVNQTQFLYNKYTVIPCVLLKLNNIYKYYNSLPNSFKHELKHNFNLKHLMTICSSLSLMKETADNNNFFKIHLSGVNN